MKIVNIDFGGTLKKPMKLKFGTRAFTLIEEISGKPLSELNMDSMESIFVLLTAGLKWQKHDLTVDKVHDMVDNMIDKVAEEDGVSFFEAMGKALGEVSELLGEALGNNEPPNDKEGE